MMDPVDYPSDLIPRLWYAEWGRAEIVEEACAILSELQD